MKYCPFLLIVGIVLTSCQGNVRDVPEDFNNPITVYFSFETWVKDASFIAIMNDTLYSNQKFVVKEKRPSLDGVENFYGLLFNEDSDVTDNVNHLMINSYLVDSTEILYLESYTSNGRRIFSRSIFDYTFIDNKTKFSRFYIDNGSFVFENYEMNSDTITERSKRTISIHSMLE